MNHVSFIFVLFVIPFVCISQETYIHTRDLSNSYYNKTGHESISYLKSNTFDKKHGTYKLEITLKQPPNGGMQSITIRGSFNNDKPDGKWAYSITNTNWKQGIHFYNSSIRLYQHWNSGIPNGEFIYESETSYRNGSRNINNVYSYTDWISHDTQYKQLTYKNGYVDGEFISGRNKQQIQFRAKFENNQITYLWYENIKHEFVFGKLSYAISVVEQFLDSWEQDYYMEYSNEDLEIINKLNSGISYKELGLDYYNDLKTFQVELPPEFFADPFFNTVYDISEAIIFNKFQFKTKLPSYYIYKYNTNRIYKQ